MKQTLRVPIGALALCGTLLLVSCGGDTPSDPPDPPPPTPSITIGLSSSSLNVTAGESGNVTVTLTRAGGFAGPVTVSATGPSGITAQSATIAAGAGSGSLIIQVAESVSAGAHQVTVQANGQRVQQVTATLTVQVTAAPTPTPTLSLSVSPATIDVEPGESATAIVGITREGGFTGTVELGISGLPDGVTHAFDPASPTGNSSTLTLTVSAEAEIGSAALTITGTGDGVDEATASLVLQVTEPAAPTPDFALSLNPTSATVQQGANVSTAVNIARGEGFTGAVEFSVSGLPDGVTHAFDPESTTGDSSTLTLTASAGAEPGSATLTITGTDEGVGARTAEFNITVTESGPGGIGNMIWTFCDWTGIPVWFAYQDGNGPWTRVVGEPGNVYRFQIDSDRGAVATVTVNQEGHPSVQVTYYTRQEMADVGALRCEGSQSGKTLNGTVTGLTPLQTVSVMTGGAGASVSGAGGSSFSLNNVIEGPQDLFATRGTFDLASFGIIPDRMIIRRGLDLPDGSTLAPLNFETEGFDMPSASVTVNGLGGDMPTVTGMFSTSTSALATYFTTLSPNTYWGVPASEMQANDLHWLQVTGSDAAGAPAGTLPDTRQVGIAFREVANRTVTLGPSLSMPTVTTVATAPYARLRAEWSRQSEYGRWVSFILMQVEEPHVMGYYLHATEGYLGGVSTITIEVPDLSQAGGWDSDWGLVVGENTIWTTTGSGWTGGPAINFPNIEEGTLFHSATRAGQITP